MKLLRTEIGICKSLIDAYKSACSLLRLNSEAHWTLNVNNNKPPANALNSSDGRRPPKYCASSSENS